jgi:hypothetical protein
MLNHHATETHGRVQVKLKAFLTSVLNRGEWSASLSSHFIPGERPHFTQWVEKGLWVGMYALVGQTFQSKSGTEPCNSSPEPVTLLTNNYPGFSLNSFMLPLLYLWGKSPQNPLYRRLGGPQSQSEHRGEEKNLLPCQESSPGGPAHTPLLYPLSYRSSLYQIKAMWK